MDSANTFNSLKPTLKDSYGDESPKKFSKTRKSLGGIALSLHKAGKDPKKYMKEQDMDITDKKGVIS